MPRTYIKVEYFRYIEMKGSVTVTDLSGKFGFPRAQAAVWLSKWVAKGYLVYKPYSGSSSRVTKRRGRGRPIGSRGRYHLSNKWWGDLIHGSGWDLV